MVSHSSHKAACFSGLLSLIANTAATTLVEGSMLRNLGKPKTNKLGNFENEPAKENNGLKLSKRLTPNQLKEALSRHIKGSHKANVLT